MRKAMRIALPGLILLILAGCGEIATLPESAGMGPHPTLPPPHPTLIPTVNIAPAKGWPPGAAPADAADLVVNAFANGLDHPRWLYVVANGDVLVAEGNAPERRPVGRRRCGDTVWQEHALYAGEQTRRRDRRTVGLGDPGAMTRPFRHGSEMFGSRRYPGLRGRLVVAPNSRGL